MSDTEEVLNILETENETDVIDDYLNYQFHEDKNKDAECFNIMSMNIRSLNANFDQFICCLNELKTDIHIIILTETWLTWFNKLKLKLKLNNNTEGPGSTETLK